MAKTIYCLAEMAYQYDGVTDLLGGGERWLEDFISLLKKKGYNVKLFQFSNARFSKVWRGHQIVGLGNLYNGIFNKLTYDAGIDEFHKLAAKGGADGVFYLSYNLVDGSIDLPKITVSHGVTFDRCEKTIMNVYNNLDFLKNNIRRATHTISVDTNTIKINAVYCPDNIKNMTYIPNYVDLNKFKPIEKQDKTKFTVLFPRRLDVARGYRTAIESCETLLSKYEDMEFIFCGKGNLKEEAEFSEWFNRMSFKDRIKHYSADPSKMHEVYPKADCSIIPTWYAEGTSLSCLESLACGVPPIVTCVGGLTDLVFNNVNGLIVMPNKADELTDAIEKLYLDRNFLSEIKENGLRMIKAFSKDRWEEEIMKVVTKIYGK